MISMPSDLSMRGRIGGFTRAARAESASAMTEAPRAAALAKIYTDAGIIPPAPDASDEELADFERRKKWARSAHMTRLVRIREQKRQQAADALREAQRADVQLRRLNTGAEPV